MYQMITNFRQSNFYHIWQYVVAFVALLLLSFINYDIHKLLECFEQASPAKQMPIAVHSKWPINCTSMSCNDDDVKISVEVCKSPHFVNPTMAFSLEGTLLKSFSPSETVAFVNWLKLCKPPKMHRGCPIMHDQGSAVCNMYTLSPFAPNDFICIQQYSEDFNLVLNGVGFPPNATYKLIKFIFSRNWAKLNKVEQSWTKKYCIFCILRFAICDTPKNCND